MPANRLTGPRGTYGPKQSMVTPMLEIKATHSELGLTIEARNGGEWQLVQLSKYKERTAPPSVRQYSTCIDPLRDEQEYFAQLDSQCIQYRRVRD